MNPKHISLEKERKFMNKRLRQCPVCNSTLEITEYHCPNCDTKICGKFGIGELTSLSRVQQEFVKIFVCSQGSIKEVEKILGISYPTVKNRLAEVTKVLCSEIKQKSDESSEIILAELDGGKISVEQAIKKLKKRS
jgi:hypothetical protein